ncbi:hypothetical protein D3C87_1259860 [compost metagenome]
MNRFKNSCFCFVLLSSLLYLSCKKEDKPPEVALTKQAENERLLSTAKTWLRENSSLPKSNHQSDFVISSFVPNWEAYSIRKNSAGTKVINLPLLPIKAAGKQKQAYYVEVSVLLDKDGIAQGMVKEYMENPYAGKTRVNIYTGSGRLFMTGIYDPKTRMMNTNGQDELSGIGKSGSNAKGGAKIMYYDPDKEGYDLEEVGITAPYPPPPPPVYPGEPYYPAPIPGLPVGPGPEPDGGGPGSAPDAALTAEEQALLAALLEDYKGSMSAKEKEIYEAMSSRKQLQYLTNAKTALDVAALLYPGNQTDSKADAFRHTLFNALNTVGLGHDLAKSLGDAHELNPGTALGIQMDLWNNAQGRAAGLATPVLFDTQARSIYAIQELMDAGKLRYISNGELTPSNQ